ncbi:NAD(P)H-dependent oxidoreductase [Mycobacterium shinjukuense]|uniref:NAD(P)H-dependent oxidoreductase n=1 Tax=Mycobacterium shinjukuense TaxID=398694 RepID=A0A7I7MMJ7_9MYCO|nr:NAD(P)H-dependent oxidoreductase [Mycobacterium shinjukuense]ORB66560.1 FMN reductase [Mycobacterium shinjukuense]BBX72723.1 NAD(P)H-dependent oxidoreductase [Mycobacterium shinjukuense]
METKDRREQDVPATRPEGKPDIKVLALVGSLRAASVNRQIAELAVDVAPDGVAVTVFEGLGDLPFYNEDIDTPAAVPAAVTRLRAAAADAHAALVVTPEYNGTIPAVLKNAIDWLSRPFGNGALKDKPLAVIGGAMGRFGGVWAHDETRKSFGIAGTRVVDGIKLSVPLQTLEGRPPADDAELSANVRDVVGKLAAEVN